MGKLLYLLFLLYVLATAHIASVLIRTSIDLLHLVGFSLLVLGSMLSLIWMHENKPVAYIYNPLLLGVFLVVEVGLFIKYESIIAFLLVLFIVAMLVLSIIWKRLPPQDFAPLPLENEKQDTNN